MKEHSVSGSPQAYARIAGCLYLIVIVAGVFAEFFVRGKLIVSGDAAATAHNIMVSQLLWRSGFAADMVGVACYVAVTLVLYVLLRPVDQNLSLLAAFFSLVGCTILGIVGLGHFAALLILGGANYLKAFDPHQLQALTLLTLQLHAWGYEISVIFFDVYAILLGYLIFRSGYLPRSLGVLLTVSFVANLIVSFADFVAPAFADRVPPAVLTVSGVAELALCLWLIVMGVNVRKWEAQT